MTTMTIHVEDAFALSLRNFAAKKRKSINQTVKDIVAPVIGLASANGKAADPYADIVGAMSHEDACEMKSVLSAQRVIDPEMWQ